MKVILRNTLVVTIGAIVGFALSEFLARAFLEPPQGYFLYSREKNTAHASLQGMASDPRLLVHVAPNAPGHDKRGFRNLTSIESADIVAIGDSQTWGINVSRSEAWPSVLAKLGNLNVYSMSLGGWGPLQYEILAEDAIALNPKAILVGMYLGNDIFDSCNHVYGTGAYLKYRQTGESHAAALTDLLARLEVTNGHARIDEAHRQLAAMGRGAKMWQGIARRSLVVQILMTRGLLPTVPSVDELYQMADTAWAHEHPQAAAVYHAGNHSTILTFGYRGVAVDLENACIRDGVRITKEVLNSLELLKIRTGTRVGIVFIPTKERVYAGVDVSLQARLNPAFEALVRNESAIKEQLIDQCRTLSLICIDATTRMIEAVKQGAILYRPDSDGHPLAEGYRQIALAARQALEQMRLVKPDHHAKIADGA